MAGCQVLEAADGRDALTQALSSPPAIAVVEAVLPLIDGYTLCALLRHDSTTRAVPILMITTRTDPRDVARARESGADVVLPKPAVGEVFLNEVWRLIALAGGARPRVRIGRDPVSEQLRKAADLIEISSAHRRTFGHRNARYATSMPPFKPPALVCPVCRTPLLYEESQISGISAHYTDQWVRFRCRAAASCGSFEYRHRTRKLKRTR